MCPINAEYLRPRVMVDASNVARDGTSEDEKGHVRKVETVLSRLKEADVRYLGWADASLRWHVDDPDRLEGLYRGLKLLQTEKGTEADQTIISSARAYLALGTPVYILSKDRFRDHQAAAGIPRISFEFYDDETVSFRPQLHRLLGYDDYDSAFPNLLLPKDVECPHPCGVLWKTTEALTELCDRCGEEMPLLDADDLADEQFDDPGGDEEDN
jgi:hypothetical protein